MLDDYRRDVQVLPNESAKTTRFASLVQALFPGSKAVVELSAGIEKRLRIESGGKIGTRRIDSYYGNAIIEFERSLKATETTARRQLCEYAAGVWAQEGRPFRPLLCVASDGTTWKTFLPILLDHGQAKPSAGAVTLQPLQTITLAPESLREFWMWLTSLLFREGQTLPTTERFEFDFGSASPAYADAFGALERAWEAVGQAKESQLAFDIWQKYLTYTYGRLAADKQTPAQAREIRTLFFKHTYLASVARLLVWASLSGGRASVGLAETAQRVLSGEYFASQGIENLAEDDFFQWVRRPKAASILAPVWERILAELQTYDLSRVSQDVLKGVYQELVDPRDRHELGEYYTPDWLCEHIVSELLPKAGYAPVLDPTCGSGSFLRAAIAHFISRNAKDDGGTQLDAILRNVVGIDIHPLAVTIARATYVIALRTHLKKARRPVQIPVYLADSLFLPREVKQGEMFSGGSTRCYDVELGRGRARRTIQIPISLVENAEVFDRAITAAAKVARDHASSGKETQASLKRYIERSAGGTLAAGADTAKALWQLCSSLADLIRAEENSIWAFIVRNAYRPAMLGERFEYLIGNPPWLAYRDIADPFYQDEVRRRAIHEYAIAPKAAKLLTHMELATVFLVHALSTFGCEGARLGFVMPRSVLNSDQHQNLRDRKYKAPVLVERYDDLYDVTPLFRVPSCVLYARKLKDEYPRWFDNKAQSLPARIWSGKLSAKDVPWSKAEHSLSIRDVEAKLVRLGERSAFSSDPVRTLGGSASAYLGRCEQGATIVPRNCYFVNVTGLDGPADADRVYWCETDLLQAESAKPPYKSVRMKGHIEGRFLFGTAVSKHVLPFVVMGKAVVVLPIDARKDGSIEVVAASELKERGFREVAIWMERVEKIWREKRGQKADRQSVYDRLNYQNELTKQNFKQRHLVVYNASGTDVCAAQFDTAELTLPFVVDHKLYWIGCKTRAETDYLSAVLNSAVVNETVKPFQSRGLLGERDIHKKILSLPIPLFDGKNPAHVSLAELGREAQEQARKLGPAWERAKAVGRRRTIVRTAIGETLADIDAQVRRLLRGR